MRIRDNLSSIINRDLNYIPNLLKNENKIGKVYGIVTTENTPTKKQFERVGGFSALGTIFYKDSSDSFNVEGDNSDDFLDTCKLARPFSVNTPVPIIGELVYLKTAQSPYSQLSPNAEQEYYSDIINLFNNNQYNSLSDLNLGKFIENPNLRNLQIFEGDVIYQGRKGNGIRFGSTTKFSKANEWSKVGKDGDPITILVNGYETKDTGSFNPIIEEINKEKSSIYLTSTQVIPLIPDRNEIVNPFTKPLLVNKYNHSQIILNSDRIVFNSKKNEIMLFAKTNIELSTNNIINFNAKKRVHFNTPNIFLGIKENGELPDEPLLLGNKTQELFVKLLELLSELGNNLSTVVSTPQGSPLVGVVTAGETMISKIEELQELTKNITSSNNFTT